MESEKFKLNNIDILQLVLYYFKTSKFKKVLTSKWKKQKNNNFK